MSLTLWELRVHQNILSTMGIIGTCSPNSNATSFVDELPKNNQVLLAIKRAPSNPSTHVSNFIRFQQECSVDPWKSQERSVPQNRFNQNEGAQAETIASYYINYIQ